MNDYINFFNEYQLDYSNMKFKIKSIFGSLKYNFETDTTLLEKKKTRFKNLACHWLYLSMGERECWDA